MSTELNQTSEDKKLTRTDASAKNSLVTANGIALGLEFSFLVNYWLKGDEPWELIDWWFGAPFLVSIILLTVSLALTLWSYHLSVKRYETASRFFMLGVVFAFISVGLSPLTEHPVELPPKASAIFKTLKSII